mmetsp:Transcript_110341/g.306827  ORF Transcript_110341/g.306827 Transcript_110341/m.306827 type:complete len:128 (+) Transcript_110341:214-597(+)
MSPLLRGHAFANIFTRRLRRQPGAPPHRRQPGAMACRSEVRYDVPTIRPRQKLDDGIVAPHSSKDIRRRMLESAKEQRDDRLVAQAMGQAEIGHEDPRQTEAPEAADSMWVDAPGDESLCDSKPGVH